MIRGLDNSLRVVRNLGKEASKNCKAMKKEWHRFPGRKAEVVEMAAGPRMSVRELQSGLFCFPLECQWNVPGGLNSEHSEGSEAIDGMAPGRLPVLRWVVLINGS